MNFSGFRSRSTYSIPEDDSSEICNNCFYIILRVLKGVMFWENLITKSRFCALFEFKGPILWSKLDKNDKTCKSLSEFRNRMRNKDLTSLIDDGCKGCLLCDS